MAKETVHPHRGHKVHPAHTVRGVDHHKKMDHYPTSQKHSGYSTAEPPTQAGPCPGMPGMGGPMDGGMSDGMDGAPMGGAGAGI